MWEKLEDIWDQLLSRIFENQFKIEIAWSILLAVALGIYLVFFLDSRPEEHHRDEIQRTPASNEEKRQKLDQVMADAGKAVRSVSIASGSLEIAEESQKPFAVYVVSVVQSPAVETYLFNSEEYILDIGSGVKTGELCRSVKAAFPQEVKTWMDEAQFQLGLGYPPFEGGVQIPAGPFLRDLARIFGFIDREPEETFSSLEIFVKGFADGNIAQWERTLESHPYDFHRIKILPQLDDKNSVTPRRFMSTPIIFPVGKIYGNGQLANLRAAFVEQDIVRPMLGTCLTEHSASVRILEGYVSRRTKRDPLKRKVEIYLSFYS
jgi:hypothetical protein